jgi:two-component system, OmpR family, response regulator
MDQHKRVLIVDDDPDVRKLITSALTPYGLIVDSAGDGEEALGYLRENAYAVILLDLLMPKLDGFGVLAAMKTDGMQSPPVVLVVTGADRTVVERLDPERIHGIVRKPFDAEDLATLIVACSDIKGRGSFGTMAIATLVSGAPFLAWFVRS